MSDEAFSSQVASNSTLDAMAWMIGQLLLNFGMLDQLVFNVLERELPEQDYEPMKKWHITDRVKRMIALLNAKAASKAQKEQLKQWHESFGTARDLRNHLAHGFVLLTMEADTKPPCLRIRQTCDWDAYGEESVSQVGFAELSQSFSKLNELIEQLSTWAGYKLETTD